VKGGFHLVQYRGPSREVIVPDHGSSIVMLSQIATQRAYIGMQARALELKKQGTVRRPEDHNGGL